MKQTTLRTAGLKQNNNISFPIGTAIAVKKYGQKLDFEQVFSRFKKRGVELHRLIEALITYRLTENESICRGSDWINRSYVLEKFSLTKFEERTLFRALEIAGDNYEEIILLIQKSIFSQYDFPHTDVNMDWTSFVLWGKKQRLEDTVIVGGTDPTRNKSPLVSLNSDHR